MSEETKEVIPAKIKNGGRSITLDGTKFDVQVGAFSSKANAEAYLKTVQKDYPGAFIKTF